MSERAVQVALHAWLQWGLKRIRITPNVEIGSERDVVAQYAKSRRLQEFEIKCSESDLRREFSGKSGVKVSKHQSLAAGADPVSEYYIATTFDPMFVIPDHCGHVRIRRNDNRFWVGGIVRKAPKLHNRPCPAELEKRLDQVAYWRMWTYSQKIVGLEECLKP